VAVAETALSVKSGAGRTTKWPVEVALPPVVVTWRGPVMAPAGTVVLSWVRLTVVAEAGTRVLSAPVNVTVFSPAVGLSPEPQ
jgi:hypothetical protein